MVRITPIRRESSQTSPSKSREDANTLSARERLKRLRSTADIPIPSKLIDQVIGQEHAVEVIRKAAVQRRHVLLIGEPGTGKSMLGLALAELLPKEDLVDILVYPNPEDENEPLIKTVPACEGKEIVKKARLEAMRQQGFSFQLIILALAFILPWWAFQYYSNLAQSMLVGAVMFATFFIAGMLALMAYSVSQGVMQRQKRLLTPKLLVDNCGREKAPFLDATGAHAGALLGDVLHDPFQTGGLGTPAHERVVAGMIHKAHKGVLFIDEIATLQPHTQQDLLTALQEGKYPITGQSERSAGAIVRTRPVPCQFILVAAGNYENIQHMHPALRSRIRGYGYEVYMRETMPDTPENQWKLAIFIAQEVVKDGRIPHFSREAIEEIIHEARRRANRKGHLTLRLRELGGLVRAAGDLAREEHADLVTAEHVQRAKRLARPLEEQIADQYIAQKKEYEVIVTRGTRVGRVNGLAVIGRPAAWSGILLAIEADVTPSLRQEGGRVHATGKLGEIAKEAVVNVTGLVKKLFGKDLESYDIYLQFLQTHEGVEGDSASIAAALAIISALKQLPVRQDIAMTGSLSVRGHVLPVGGVSAKVEAAVDTGMKAVIIPEQNVKDVVLSSEKRRKIRIIPVRTMRDVLEHAIDWTPRENEKKRILDLLPDMNNHASASSRRRAKKTS